MVSRVSGAIIFNLNINEIIQETFDRIGGGKKEGYKHVPVRREYHLISNIINN